MKKANEVPLFGTFPGVPYAKPPRYWDRRLPVAANLNVVKHQMSIYQKKLPEGCLFDEVAIMVPTLTVLDRVIMELTGAGWKVFNEAADVVYTNPFSTRYTVEYTFLAHRDQSFRLEVMLLGQPASDSDFGFSPLHQALWAPNGQAPLWEDAAEMPIPHLSFKVPTGITFGKCVDMLRDRSFLHAQTCQSTYGVFGYYLHQGAFRQLYVKPRVNTRDAS